MRESIMQRYVRARKDQKGFTLIEMLVVVGIIVALAAIIVPLVISFSGEGESASQTAELETVKTSIQTFMVRNNLSDVTESGVAPGKKIDRTATGLLHATFTMTDFIDQDSSTYCYVWGKDGRVTEQYDTSGETDTCDVNLKLFPE